METVILIVQLMLLGCSTAAVVFGSKLALTEGLKWAYVINTIGVVGFWIAALFPALGSVETPTAGPTAAVAAEHYVSTEAEPR